MVTPAVIKFLYPHLVPMVDYEFRDDGGGVSLHLWPEGEELPDEAAIAAAEAQIVAALERIEFKEARSLAVSGIKVTSSLGRIFDGGEVDTDRMLKPITVLKEKPEGTTWLWVLADNTPAQVGLPEFLEVLELAGREQTRLWVQE